MCRHCDSHTQTHSSKRFEYVYKQISDYALRLPQLMLLLLLVGGGSAMRESCLGSRRARSSTSAFAADKTVVRRRQKLAAGCALSSNVCLAVNTALARKWLDNARGRIILTDGNMRAAAAANTPQAPPVVVVVVVACRCRCMCSCMHTHTHTQSQLMPESRLVHVECAAKRASHNH